MNGLLEGKVAIVSGIGPGMGRDISLQFAEHGATVVAGARTKANVDAVVSEIEAMGGEAAGLQLDITDQASCDAATAAALDRFGRIDVLVNNAFSDGDHRSFMSGDLDNWRTTMETNFFGTLQLTKSVVPTMKDQHEGRIIMINSMSSVKIDPRFGAYAASKAALAAATKTLAAELGPLGIRVNSVHPGYIWSDKQKTWFEYLAQRNGITYEEQFDSVAGTAALRYLPDSAEIAGAVVFLASDLAKPITGQALHVNAGHHFGGF
ncbi:MAG TPA: SDR family oxidoreductase [Acidimicrobiales bacterium]|nr:SDR family oxidoreductase [Acidimicrobiales bacterium]